MTTLRHISCPFSGCGHINRYGHGHGKKSARECMIGHISRMHGRTMDEARRLVDARCPMAEGAPLEECMAQWKDQVSREVVEG